MKVMAQLSFFVIFSLVYPIIANGNTVDEYMERWNEKYANPQTEYDNTNEDSVLVTNPDGSLNTRETLNNMRIKYAGTEYAASMYGREDEYPQDSDREINHNESYLYRNEEYKFRIKFPDGWTVEDGDGEHVVKKATNAGSTVGVMVFDNLTETLIANDEKIFTKQEIEQFPYLTIDDFNDGEIDFFLNEIIRTNTESFPGSEILEKGTGYIDNRKAIYFTAKVPYQVLDIKTESITKFYYVIHNDKLYQIGGGYGVDPIDEEYNKPLIDASIASFVFEDWNNEANASDGSSAVVSESEDLLDENWSMIDIFVIFVGSLIFTWGYGLLVPILIRYVVIKKPLSIVVSVLIAGMTWFTQIIISELMGNHGTHGALALVAFVSYYIMRSGSYKKNSNKYCKFCGTKIKNNVSVCDQCRK